MKVTTVWCDQCQAQIGLAVMHSGRIDGDFCSVECIQKAESGEPEGCPHEDNATDAVPGRSTARLVCKQCGYDREEEVA